MAFPTPPQPSTSRECGRDGEPMPISPLETERAGIPALSTPPVPLMSIELPVTTPRPSRQGKWNTGGAPILPPTTSGAASPVPLTSIQLQSPHLYSARTSGRSNGGSDPTFSQSFSYRQRNSTFLTHTSRLRDLEGSLIRSLVSTFQALSNEDKRLILKYGKTVFRKTRFHVHLWFLSTCKQHNLQPQNLALRFTPLTNNEGPYTRVLRRTSQELLSVTITELRAEISSLSANLFETKNTLLGKAFRLELLREVRKLNSQYFHTLKMAKLKKLRQLGLPLKDPEPEYHPTKVFTIPDDLELSNHERAILAKGLSFVPAPKASDSYDIQKDLNRFTRSMRLREFFADKPKTERSVFELINPKYSTWTPPSTCPALQYFEECAQRVLPQNVRNRPNLTEEEKAALQRLRRRRDIVIKPADKGGAVVVWRRDLYIQEALRQLNNPQHYYKLVEDPTEQYTSLVASTINNFIQQQDLPPEASRLNVSDARCSRFYLLPKIHKPSVPGRPIVSACACPTMHISAFVDSVLQPIVESTPAFLKDTTDFLLAIKDVTYGQEFTMVTGDVASLYTVIPHVDGLSALKHFLEKRPMQSPSTTCILRLAELVLTLNAFEFDGSYYQQTSGVAMGTKMGPSYADLFMAYLEHHLWRSQQPPEGTLYKRFRDDIFLFTPHNRSSVQPFLAELNRMHPNIVIEFQEGNSLPFLDTLVTAKNSGLTTTVYYKPTDSHSYLLYSSFHPRRTREAIPYSQFLRLRRICSDDLDFQNKCEEMKTFFLGKLYPRRVVESAYERVLSVTREASLQKTRKPNEDILPFVITYGDAAQRTITGVRKVYGEVVAKDPRLSQILPDHPTAAYRRPRNLRDLLVSARLPSTNLAPPTTPGTFPCNVKKCLTCKHVAAVQEIKGKKGKRRIHHRFDCRSKCVIYAIFCAKCNIIYIGETKRMLRERFREHLYGLTHGIPTEVTEHFTNVHSREDMRVTALQHAPSNVDQRRELEARIIYHLGTVAPDGLNTDFEFL